MEVYHMLKAGETLEMIQQEVEGEKLQEFFDSLIRKQFLVEGEEVDPSYMIPDDHYIKEGKMLEHLRLNVTETCNLRCSYCYERVSEVWNQKRIMSWDVAKKAIDQFLFYIKKNEKKKISVRFFGGEPLLNWDLVEKSMDYIQNELSDEVQVHYIMNTNGTLIDNRKAKFLADHQISVSLSVDGVRDIHDKFRVYPNGSGSFDVVDEKMNHLIEHRCRFNLSVVCTEETLTRLTDFIDYISEKQKACDYPIPVCFNFVQITEDEGRLSEDEKIDLLVKALTYADQKKVQSFGGLTHFVFEKLLHNYIGTYCGGSGSEFSVAPSGDIFPCSGLDIHMGNVESFAKIFQSESYKNLCRRKSGNIMQCQDCEIECFCSGGCIADVVSKVDQANGYFDGYVENQMVQQREKPTYPYCELQKKLFRKLVNYYLL
ncbi:MAG: radical SAM protein [Hungatella sp.]